MARQLGHGREAKGRRAKMNKSGGTVSLSWNKTIDVADNHTRRNAELLPEALA